MTDFPRQGDRAGSLRLAIVVSAAEETCTIVEQNQRTTLPYVPFFPRPRAGRVASGHWWPSRYARRRRGRGLAVV